MSETTNLPMGGSESAHSLSLEEAANLDFLDPSEDNQEVEQDQTSEIEPDEAMDGQEADEPTEPAEDDDPADDTDDGPDDPSDKPEPEDDVTVTVNGERVSLKELKAGFLRRQDYTHKTQEVADRRRDLEALSARVHQSVEAIVDHLTKQIPPAPDPKLAYTNPTAFVQQKAMHEAAVAEVEALLSQVNSPKEVQQQLSQEKLSEIREAELAALAEKFPTTRSKEGFDQFFQTAAAAAKELGYTDAEIQSALDHRLFALSYYASLGMKAEQAKQKAKAKVQSVPPVAPQKAANQGVKASVARRNQEAMKRLAKTGSIHDALAIDFD